MILPVWVLRSLWLIILAFSACVPSETPPSVNATPGAAAVITRDSYTNDAFSVTYPAGWRVITSPAGAPPSVTFVAPGDCALIIVSSAPLDQPPVSPACDPAGVQTVERAVALGEQPIIVAGSAPAAGWDEFLRDVDRLVASLRVGS